MLGRSLAETFDVATAVMTVVVVIFAEVMPKSWAIANADRFATAVAPILRPVIAVLSPFAAVVTGLVRWILNLFGVHLTEIGRGHDRKR